MSKHSGGGNGKQEDGGGAKGRQGGQRGEGRGQRGLVSPLAQAGLDWIDHESENKQGLQGL